MLTSTSSRLFRLLLSIVNRLPQSFGRIVFALRARFASLLGSVLTFARRGGQTQIRLHANNVPAVENDSKEEHQQVSGPTKVKKEGGETLAAFPVSRPACWPDKLAKYQGLIPLGGQLTFDPRPAIPGRGLQRYKRKLRVVSPRTSYFKIPAGQQELLDALPPLPDGWRRHVHPEGNPFFYHEELRIFTENDVTRNAEEILFNATTLIQEAIERGGITLDEFTEIVLNVDENQCWYYYFVDHKHRLLFWVQPVEVQHVLDTELQITEYSHIKYLVETRYWYPSSSGFQACFHSLRSISVLILTQVIVYDMESRSHCEYYPQDRTLPKGIIEKLRGMLNFAKTDMMTSYSSTSPFAQDEVVAILDLVNSLKDDEASSPYSIWVISRLMRIFTENQFLNFYGEPYARLNADTSLFGQQDWNRGIIFRLVNMFSFWSLGEYAARLRRVWVDGLIIQPRWKDFINRFRTELAQYTIFSTVMLAVDVSFLAVPGIIAEAQSSSASSIHILIYCSVVSAVACIVFSLTLSNLYNDPELMDSGPAGNVMWALSQTGWGMPCFAIMHSLPNICVIWSIALFSTALGVQIFGPKEIPTSVTLGVECLIFVLFGFMSFVVKLPFYMGDDVGEMDVLAED